MFLLIAVIVGLVTVPLAGGRLRRLADAPVRLAWVPLVAVGLQGSVAMWSSAPRWVLVAGHVLSYAVAGLFVVANRHVAGVLLLGLGGGLNALAIVANGGVMPASPAAVARSGLVHTAERFHNSAIVDNPRLAVLGDVFAIPESWPASNVFSFGDVVLAVAAVVVVHGLAGCAWAQRLPWVHSTPRRSRVSISD
jgi:hypothetical protein